MKRAVFFDRDGTLIEDVGYLGTPEGVELRPGAADAVGRVNEAGLLVVVVSNQSGVARGKFTTEDVERVNERVRELFADEGARIDAFYYCPHLPTGTVPGYAKQCDCRKPKPGLLHQAARDLDIDLTESFVVGDAVRDVEAGRAAHCRTIFLGDPVLLDAGDRGRLEAFADSRARTLADAVRFISSRVPAPAPSSRRPAGAERPDTRPETPEPREATPMTSEQPPPASEQPESSQRTCDRCGRPVAEADLAAGRALERQGRCLCARCRRELSAKRRSGESELQAPVAPTESGVDWQTILDELRNITRALTFERFSAMNLLGGVIQVGALACLFKAYQLGTAPGSGAVTMLFWAIALQLIVVTCFTLGRR